MILTLLIQAYSPYERLAGHYVGPMYFYDTFEKKDKQFEIDLNIDMDRDGKGMTWRVKYRYAPPRYQLEVQTAVPSLDGTVYTEQSPSEKAVFKLTNWKEFETGASTWYEIERKVLNDKGVYDFRRRFTLKNGGIWSEKSIRFPGKDWEFSHRMELRKIPAVR
jgi:hypothetical protein